MLRPTKKTKIALTLGDPAGIGPEICAKALKENFDANIILIGDMSSFFNRADELKIVIDIQSYKKEENQSLSYIDTPAINQVKLGEPDFENAASTLKALKIASEMALNNEVDVITTAPVAKYVLKAIDKSFVGQTEFFAKLANVSNPVMVLMNDKLIVALVTTHIPVKDVAVSIQTQSILQVITTCNDYLKKYLNIDKLEIKVCGLNPHAGEEELMGTEEVSEITPAILHAKDKGINVSGPYSADTVFLNNIENTCIVAMYHDQALPVIKTSNFANTINVTLGLPFIRTSVDHGTAFDIAPKLCANHSSLVEAVNAGIDFHQNANA